MHLTKTGKLIKHLMAESRQEWYVSQKLKKMDNSHIMSLAVKLESSSIKKQEIAEELKRIARLEDLRVYKVMAKRVINKNGKIKYYTYWYASWRAGGKVTNRYIGSSVNMSYEKAMKKARNLKAKALGNKKVQKI